MRFYKLMSELANYPKGTVFTLTAKHKLMAGLTFMEQRQILWEEISKEQILAMAATNIQLTPSLKEPNETSH